MELIVKYGQCLVDDDDRTTKSSKSTDAFPSLPLFLRDRRSFSDIVVFEMSTLYHQQKRQLPRVSVIMTHFNCSRFFVYALSSIALQQSYHDLEIIVVDDCSSPLEWNNVLSHVRLIRQKLVDANRVNVNIVVHSVPRNVGTYVCKNVGVAISTGQYLTFQDADDMSAFERIEEQVVLCQTSILRSLLLQTKDRYPCLEARMDQLNGLMQPISSRKQEKKTNVASLDGGYCGCYLLHMHRPIKAVRSSDSHKPILTEISLFMDKSVFCRYLGFFDAVRFAADTEIRHRISALSLNVGLLSKYGYTCLDKMIDMNSARPESLTQGGNLCSLLMSDTRLAYAALFEDLYSAVAKGHSSSLRYSFFGTKRQVVLPFHEALYPNEENIAEVYSIYQQSIQSYFCFM